MSRNLIAILRGVRPDKILPIGKVLLEAGINKIEVPLNSPEPFESIKALGSAFPDQGIFGAGTVLTVDEVQQLAELGAQMVVSPNCNRGVITAAKKAGLLSFPGVMSPSECFAALDAGADGLKFFPGELVGPAGLKAMRAVLPKNTNCLAVGGAKPDNFEQWLKAGADGFGIGSALYKPGMSADEVKANAQKIVSAFDMALENTAQKAG